MSDVTTPPERDAWLLAHEHAWRHFELHAAQRISVFNFFTFASGLVLAGIAATLQGPTRFSLLGVALGVILALLSFVFWKLDQRSAFLVKHGEAMQKLSEAKLLPDGARTMTLEPAALATARDGRARLTRIWTFGSAFRTLFVTTAAFGLAAACLCGLRASGHVSWDAPQSKPANSTPAACSRSKRRPDVWICTFATVPPGTVRP